MKSHPASSADWIENDATAAPLGWHHMPAFGSGYREFAASSLPLSLAPAIRPATDPQTLPLESFWSTVAHAIPRPTAALC